MSNINVRFLSIVTYALIINSFAFEVIKMRRASHAGIWYSGSGDELSNQLSAWLNKVDVWHGPARAIIAPHAGYKFSGACSAFAYKQVDPDLVNRIFILGPSHHVRMSKCSLTKMKTYETPLYNLEVDYKVNEELMKTGYFEYMDVDVDENEHSIEMHLPYIAKVMDSSRNKSNFTIVPILVGALNAVELERYGNVLAKYLDDPLNLFVISSDFCHWGTKFHYTYYNNIYGEIYESIAALDREGMEAIEKLSPNLFRSYLKEFGNTICGRYPISILIEAIREIKKKDEDKGFDLKFLNYVQSNSVRTINESSVSYAAASLKF